MEYDGQGQMVKDFAALLLSVKKLLENKKEGFKFQWSVSDPTWFQSEW